MMTEANLEELITLDKFVGEEMARLAKFTLSFRNKYTPTECLQRGQWHDHLWDFESDQP